MSFTKFTIEDLYQGVTLTFSEEGPSYSILVCVHGNETCGLKAIMSLQESGDLYFFLKKGSLSILLANKEAYQKNQRIIHCDLNRSIGKENLSYPYERKRAILVENLIRNSDYTLDLHSTSSPSPSHAIPCDKICSEEISKSLPVDYVVKRVAHLTVEGGTTLDFARDNDRCAITVECGQHEDPQSVETAQRCIQQFLLCQSNCNPDIIVLECDASVEVKEGFSFSREFSGFDFVDYQVEVATDENGSILTDYPNGAYIVMPNSNPKIGEEAFYWAIKG